MQIFEGNINNNGLNIYYLTNSITDSDKTPVVLIPGLFECAEDYIDILTHMTDVKCFVLSLRGRGKSCSPETGYSLTHHAHDIEVAINSLNLDEYVLMGYSSGVSYMFEYILKHAKSLDNLKGIIIGDYPAIHRKFSDDFTSYNEILLSYTGQVSMSRMDSHVIEQLKLESHTKSFWGDLYKLQVPALIICGGKNGSMISQLIGREYTNKLYNSNLVVFQESSHNIYEPDLSLFTSTIQNFLQAI